MESRPNKAFDDFKDSGSLEELLAAQRAVVEQALAFNEAIAERVAEVKPPRQIKFKTTEDTTPASPTKPVPAFGTDVTKSTLTEPLIGRADSPIRMNDIHSASGTPRSLKSTTSKSTSSDLVPAKKAMSWHMFPTLEGVKEHVDKALNKEEAPDDDNYGKTGCFPWIARHPWFTSATLAVIIANTIWIAYDTDHNHADLLMKSKIQFQVAGHFFCGFFTLELLIRFLAFRSKWSAILDPWFAFEMFLVGLMIWETWVESLLFLNGCAPKASGGRSASVLRICRIFRLLRVARTGRVLNAVPELMILAKGMFAGVRSVMVTLTLLALIIYIFAIVFTQLLAGSSFDLENDSNFANVPVSANFLLLQVLAGFDPDFAVKLLAFMPVGYLMLLVYVLLGSLTIMNMLIGILCDVVFSVAEGEKEEREEHEMENKLDHLAAEIDVSRKGVVTKVDFEDQIHKAGIIQQFDDLGVDVAGLIDFAHFVFQENGELSYRNFEHMVTQFTGSKPASVKDIMNLRKQVSVQMSQVLQAYELTHEVTTTVCDKLDIIIPDGVEGYNKSNGDAKMTARSLIADSGNKKRESPTQVKDRVMPQSPVSPVKPSDANWRPLSRPLSLTASLPPSFSKKETNATSSRPSSISPSGGAPLSNPSSTSFSRSPVASTRPPQPSPGSSSRPLQFSSVSASSTPPTPPRRFAYQGSPDASSFRTVEVDDSSQPQSSPFAATRLSSTSISPSSLDNYRKTRETKAAAENFAKKYTNDRM